MKSYNLLCQPSGRGVKQGPSGGLKITFQNKKSKETQSGLKSPLPQEGKSQCSENQDFGITESLEFLYELCMIEDSLLKLFDKLNDSQYMNGIVSLSSYMLTNAEISLLSKGLGFGPIQGHQVLAILSMIWML